MGGTGAGDEHRIHVGIVDGRNRIGLHARPNLPCDLGRLVGEEVIDDGDPRAAHSLAQRVHMEGAHHADAENGDPQVITHGCLRNSMVAPLQELR